jgi:peptidoglycan/LPS O-acetylase OafA/YrhL
MLSHGSHLHPVIDMALPRSLVYGPVAVFVFFMISGFVIGEAALKFYDGRPVQFFLNRLIRLYPPYLMALALTGLVMLMVPKFEFPGVDAGLDGSQHLTCEPFFNIPLRLSD